MVMKLITEAGYYNGVFKPAGQTYDDGAVGADDAPADLTAPGPIAAETREASSVFLDDSGLTGQTSAQSENLESLTSEGSSSIPAATLAQPAEIVDAKPVASDPPAPIPVLDAVQGEQKA